jgi:Tfp pilus assembly protein PilE
MLIFIFIPELPQTFALASVILVAVLLLMAFCSYLGEYRKLYREQIKTIKTQK